jgi:hypothetical protein
MLSLDEFRQLLGDDGAALNQDDLERLHREMYAFAEVALSIYEAGRRTRREAIRLLPDDEAEAVAERSAIIEFEGDVDRDRADRIALTRATRR